MFKTIITSTMSIALFFCAGSIMAVNFLGSTQFSKEVGWNSYVQANSKKAGSYVKIENGKVIIYCGSNSKFGHRSIQLQRKHLFLEAGKSYIVKFKAKIDKPGYLYCTYRRGTVFEKDCITRILPGKEDYQFTMKVKNAAKAQKGDIGILFFFQGTMYGTTLTIWNISIVSTDGSLPKKRVIVNKPAGTVPGKYLTQLEQVNKIKDFIPNKKQYRIYFIGDSITRHGFDKNTIKKLKWDHMAGMAASSEDKDFAHLVAYKIKKLFPNKKIKLFFGRGKDAVNAITGINDAKIYRPNLVIVQLGEHVRSKAFGHATEDSPEKIDSDYGTLLDALKALPSSPQIICTGSWNPIPGAKKYHGRNAQIDKIQKAVCAQKGVSFISVEKYALDPSCSGTGGSGGVKWHPNNAGHKAYAKEIIAAFKKLQVAKVPVGTVVYEASGKNWPGWAAKPAGCIKRIPDGRGGNCIEVGAKGKGKEGAVGNRDVLGIVEKSKSSTYLFVTGIAEILEKYKGYELEVEVGVKGMNIPKYLKPWEGVYISTNYTTTTSPYSHCYYNTMSDSFDWRNISYRIRIPSDMTNMSINLGLVAPFGKVYFDHIKMTVSDIPLTMKTPLSKVTYKGYKVPRLRGFNTGIKEPGNKNAKKSFNMLAQKWKVNVVKLWFNQQGDFRKIDDKLAQWIDSVEKGLDTARLNKQYFILHINSNWKSKKHGRNELFYEKPEYANKLIEQWKTIAKRFKGRKEIYAFELLNESQLRMPVAKGCYDYPELMERVAKAINEIDPTRTIIVQTEEWWGPKAFYKMRPIKAKNIVYAVHFYSPFPVSHQGIGEFQLGKTSWVANAYPGTYDKIKWNKETLKRELQPVRDFQQAYNVQIIVSEFGCIRWALGDSRYKLLKDMIDVYEEYGWDWLYHSYPEWPGWSPALGSDPWNESPPATPSKTETLLKSWFQKNKKPNF